MLLWEEKLAFKQRSLTATLYLKTLEAHNVAQSEDFLGLGGTSTYSAWKALSTAPRILSCPHKIAITYCGMRLLVLFSILGVLQVDWSSQILKEGLYQNRHCIHKVFPQLIHLKRSAGKLCQ